MWGGSKPNIVLGSDHIHSGMVKLLIIANDAPYGGEKTWNALRLAGASVTAEIGMQVRVFLMGDSVGACKEGSEHPRGIL